MNYLEEPNQSTKGYDLFYCNRESFELDVNYIDDHYGYSSVTLDALEVYKHLKAYFKGTPHEL